MAENEIRERMVELLEAHPEGMTILGIAQALELNRNTITKYVYELSGAGIIVQRKVGSAKLCFVPKPSAAKTAIKNMKNPKIAKFLPVMALLPLLFLQILAYPALAANAQSHPLSELTPIDTNFDMMQYNILNLTWANATSINASNQICVGGICRTSWPTGTVTSVGLSMPTELTVTGSPVTTSGTLTAAWASQSANTVLAAPSGGAGTPSFRVLAVADIPNLDAGKITAGTLANARLDSKVYLINSSGLDAANITTGTLLVARGGTGQSSLTTGRVLIGAGTSAVTLAGPTAANQVLRSTAADAPAWGSLVAADIPNLDASKITTGTLSNARLDSKVYFINNSGMSASNITTGTISNARLDSNIGFLNNTQTWTGTNTINALTLGGNANANANSITGAAWMNSTNFNATTNVCIGNVCRTSWPTTGNTSAEIINAVNGTGNGFYNLTSWFTYYVNNATERALFTADLFNTTAQIQAAQTVNTTAQVITAANSTNNGFYNLTSWYSLYVNNATERALFTADQTGNTSAQINAAINSTFTGQLGKNTTAEIRAAQTINTTAEIRAAQTINTTNEVFAAVDNNTFHRFNQQITWANLSSWSLNNVWTGSLGWGNVSARSLDIVWAGGLGAGNITTGTLTNARLDSKVYLINQTGGLDAANISAGTVSNARLDSNIGFLNNTQTWTGTNTVNALTLGGNANANSNSITGAAWMNATSVNATRSVNSTQFCIGTDCRTAWPTSDAGNNMTGAGTAGYIAKWENGTAVNASGIYEKGGNVGIGTTDMSGILDVSGGVGKNSGSGQTINLDAYISNPFFSAGEYQNYLFQTEVFNSNVWNISGNSTPVVANSAVDPIGTITAETIPAGSLSTSYVNQTIVNSTLTNWTFSVWLRENEAASGNVVIRIDNDGNLGTGANVSLTSAWKRYSVTENVNTAHSNVTVVIVNGLNSISAWGAQLQPTTAARPYSGARTTTQLTAVTRTFWVPTAIASGAGISGTTGTFSGAITGTTFTGSTSVSASVASTATASVEGLMSSSSTAATLAAPIRISPRLRFTARAWDTADRTISFIEEVLPIVNASGVSPAGGRYRWGYGYGISTASAGYTSLMDLTSSGNLIIGINTSSSIMNNTVKLIVNATNSTGGSTGAMSDALWITNATNGNLLFVNGTTGNVGIGTASPVKTLDVVGDVNATAAMFAGTWVNATNLNASNSVRGTNICIGTDCRTGWVTTGNTSAEIISAVNGTNNGFYNLTSWYALYVNNATERTLFTNTYNASYMTNTYNVSYNAQLGHNTSAEINAALNSTFTGQLGKNTTAEIRAAQTVNTTAEIRAAQTINTSAEVNAAINSTFTGQLGHNTTAEINAAINSTFTSQLGHNTTAEIRAAQTINTTAEVRAAQTVNTTNEVFAVVNNNTFHKYSSTMNISNITAPTSCASNNYVYGVSSGVWQCAADLFNTTAQIQAAQLTNTSAQIITAVNTTNNGFYNLTSWFTYYVNNATERALFTADLFNTTAQIQAAQTVNTTAQIQAAQTVNTTAQVRAAQTINTSAEVLAIAVSRTDWTTHDSYPAACTAAQKMLGLGDTLSCSADLFNTSVEINAALNSSFYTLNRPWLGVLGAGNISGLPASNVGNMTGAGSAGYLTKWANGTAVNASGIFELAGSVGIGTASPDNKLDVSGTLEVGTGSRGAILQSGVGDNFQLFTYTNTPNPNWQIGYGNGAGSTDNTKEYITSNSGHISFLNAIVGIGTASPVKTLDVVGDINATAQLFLPLSGSSGGIVMGGDTNLYRVGANQLKTDDSFIVGGTWLNGTSINASNQICVGNVCRTSWPAGSVTSVGLAMPSEFGVTGSPVTSSGTLTAAWNSQTANYVLAAPSGSSGTPSFRALTATDIPNLDASKITAGTLANARLDSKVYLINQTGGLDAANITTGTFADARIASAATWNAKMTNPMTTTGDIIYGGASGAATRLGGAAGFLKSTGAAAPAWSALAAGDLPSHVHAATDITSATLANVRLDGTVGKTNSTQTWTSTQTVNSLTLGGNMNAANYDVYGIKNTNTTNLFASGNVGIGTASPARKLSLVGGNFTVSNDTVARSDIYWDATNARLVILVA